MNPRCPVCQRESKAARVTGRFPRHGKIGHGPCAGSYRKVTR